VSVILDASALLAFLHGEPGEERVAAALDGARVSAVNWAEVLQKARQRGADIDGMHGELTRVGVVLEPFTPDQAEIAARLWEPTRRCGLSLADRACLALALDRSLPVMTADRAWSELGLAIEVELLR